MIHGTVLVNSNPVGYWRARRTEVLMSTESEQHEYEWYVEAQPNPALDAPQDKLSAFGRLTHRYADGQVVLMAKIMQAAAEAGVAVG